MLRNKKGFTLIELLIVIAIVAVLAAIVFVALDPATRFQDSRDARRFSDVAEVLHAIKIDEVDNGGYPIAAVSALTDGETYMIGTATTGCDVTCDATITSTTHCVDLSGLVTEGYFGSIPISPNGTGSWSASLTGYALTPSSTGTLTVQACESENVSSISLSR